VTAAHAPTRIAVINAAVGSQDTVGRDVVLDDETASSTRPMHTQPMATISFRRRGCLSTGDASSAVTTTLDATIACTLKSGRRRKATVETANAVRSSPTPAR
jgi:nicotinate-nucleotide pyrophosphorylase